MNQATYNALSGSLDSLTQTLLRKRMMEQESEDKRRKQALEEAMLEISRTREAREGQLTEAQIRHMADQLVAERERTAAQDFHNTVTEENQREASAQSTENQAAHLALTKEHYDTLQRQNEDALARMEKKDRMQVIKGRLDWIQEGIKLGTISADQANQSLASLKDKATPQTLADLADLPEGPALLDGTFQFQAPPKSLGEVTETTTTGDEMTGDKRTRVLKRNATAADFAPMTSGVGLRYDIGTGSVIPTGGTGTPSAKPAPTAKALPAPAVFEEAKVTPDRLTSGKVDTLSGENLRTPSNPWWRKNPITGVLGDVALGVADVHPQETMAAVATLEASLNPEQLVRYQRFLKEAKDAPAPLKLKVLGQLTSEPAP